MRCRPRHLWYHGGAGVVSVCPAMGEECLSDRGNSHRAAGGTWGGGSQDKPPQLTQPQEAGRLEGILEKSGFWNKEYLKTPEGTLSIKSPLSPRQGSVQRWGQWSGRRSLYPSRKNRHLGVL